MHLKIAIAFFALCAMCIFLYWLLHTDAYFTKKNTHKAVGKVMQSVCEKGLVQYKVRFEDHEHVVRTAMSPHYAENDILNENYNVRITYVSFRIFKKHILSIRLHREGLVLEDGNLQMLALAMVFGALGVLRIFW